MAEREVLNKAVGTRYLQINKKTGVSKISTTPKTKNPIKLNLDETWIISQNNDEITNAGNVVVDDIINIPDGSIVDVFTDEELYYQKATSLAVPFKSGMVLTANKLVSYNGNIYKTIQAHTTQIDWKPDVVPALFSKIQAPGISGYPEWKQPIGAFDAYKIGDKVTYKDKNYECVAGDASGNNVWSPTTYGWKVID